jgi:D-inositol-3-phosphate glycosyltransferase
MSNNGPTPAVRPEPRTLLVAGLYSPGSGLTNVLTILMRELSESFSVTGLGFKPDAVRSGFDTHVSGSPLHVHSSPAMFFAADPQWLDAFMEQRAPQGILINGPPFLAGPFLRQLQKYRPRTKVLLYLPVEGKLANDEICKTLEMVDACILYTEDARDNLTEIYSQAKQKDAGYHMPQLYVAGHGVDTSRFFPLRKESFDGSRSIAKRALFPDRPELHNSFMVLNANCIYLRKRLDLTIKGFAEFAAARPDSYLYLHTGQASAQQLSELEKMIDDSGVGERVLFNTLTPDLSRLSVKDLNLLYNACDVGLTTAMGEGWGLVSFEHAATGAPQIVPDHTSFAENWTGAAEMIPITGREYIFYELADMFTVSPEHVATSLERLYLDKAYRAQMAQASYERATAAQFRWDHVGSKFRSIVEETLDPAAIFSSNAAA